MIAAVLDACASEIAFLLGIIVGTAVASIARLAVLATTSGRSSLSGARALFDGTVSGVIAGAAGLSLAIALGRRLSVPGSWMLWIVTVPPAVGEFGHFLNRFSLRFRHKPDSGLLAPLGRAHGAAWAPLRRLYFTLGVELFKGEDSEQIPLLAVRRADWCVDRAVFGLAIGAAVSIWWIWSRTGLASG
jgi:hypothetical protein